MKCGPLFSSSFLNNVITPAPKVTPCLTTGEGFPALAFTIGLELTPPLLRIYINEYPLGAELPRSGDHWIRGCIMAWESGGIG